MLLLCFLQEAATSIGYGAAALPLWEEFVLRFFKHETQLGPIVPKDAISAHLAKLAQLYEGSSPVLSNIYALLAPLSPESLPGVLLGAVHCCACHPHQLQVIPNLSCCNHQVWGQDALEP